MTEESEGDDNKVIRHPLSWQSECDRLHIVLLSISLHPENTCPNEYTTLMVIRTFMQPVSHSLLFHLSDSRYE